MNRGARAIGMAVLLAGLAACQGGPRDAGGGEGDAVPPGRYDSEQLVGATDNLLLQAFGPPAQRRREPPAEVWQYRSTGCVVDFYLYRQQPVGLSVVHLEARNPAAGRLPVESCLPSL